MKTKKKKIEKIPREEIEIKEHSKYEEEPILNEKTKYDEEDEKEYSEEEE